jgi:hypothetical protein
MMSIATVSGTPSDSCVARASQADGVVTASLATIENRVSGKKLGSLPTNMTSVPCSVVTSLGAAARPPASAASTSRARWALTAWGIA